MQDYIAHELTEEFQRFCRKLPKNVRKCVPRKFEMLQRDPRYPSLCLSKVGTFWSIKISKQYRALAVKDNGTLFWEWIGLHDEYVRRIRQSKFRQTVKNYFPNSNVKRI